MPWLVVMMGVVGGGDHGWWVVFFSVSLSVFWSLPESLE